MQSARITYLCTAKRITNKRSILGFLVTYGECKNDEVSHAAFQCYSRKEVK
jgi:hypothetical protein